MRLIQAPTNTQKGRLLIVTNVGTAAFTLGDATVQQGINVSPGVSSLWEWNGTAWVPLDGGIGRDPIQAGNLNTSVNAPRAGRFTEYKITNIAAGDVALTCVTTGAIVGDVIRFTRTDTNAHTATIQDHTPATQFVMPNSKINFCDVRFNGTSFEFMAGGTQ